MLEKLKLDHARIYDYTRLGVVKTILDEAEKVYAERGGDKQNKRGFTVGNTLWWGWNPSTLWETVDHASTRYGAYKQPNGPYFRNLGRSTDDWVKPHYGYESTAVNSSDTRFSWLPADVSPDWDKDVLMSIFETKPADPTRQKLEVAIHNVDIELRNLANLIEKTRNGMISPEENQFNPVFNDFYDKYKRYPNDKERNMLFRQTVKDAGWEDSYRFLLDKRQKLYGLRDKYNSLWE